MHVQVKLSADKVKSYKKEIIIYKKIFNKIPYKHSKQALVSHSNSLQYGILVPGLTISVIV